MKKNKIIASIAIVAILAVPNPVSKVVYAATSQVANWFTSRDRVVNKFKALDVKVNILEEFSSPPNWDGTQVAKRVKIQNTTPNDELVRVAIIPRWIDDNGNPWAGNVNYAKINFPNPNYWIDGNDGYYYYNQLLVGQGKTQEIISHVTADIPQDQKDAYKGKTLMVDVKAEVVQPTKDAYRAVWTTTNKNIQKILDVLCK